LVFRYEILRERIGEKRRPPLETEEWVDVEGKGVWWEKATVRRRLSKKCLFCIVAIM